MVGNKPHNAFAVPRRWTRSNRDGSLPRWAAPEHPTTSTRHTGHRSGWRRATNRPRRFPAGTSFKGGYVLLEAEGGERKLTILSTGSELHLAVQAREILQKQSIPTAVVSMPCRLLFEQQEAAYKKAVLGTSRARVAVEAAVELGWERYIGFEGRFVGMHSFGASGKITDVYEKFDINAEAVVRAAHETLADVAGLWRRKSCCRRPGLPLPTAAPLRAGSPS
jgi:pyruvate dehydrogenase complex dehydrogenase (E1) component